MRGTPRRARSLLQAIVVALAASIALTGCGSTGRGPDATGHFESRTWSRAWDQFGSDGGQWIAPAVLAVATPIVWAFDKDTSEDSIGGPVFNSNTQYGDEIAIGLGVAPLVMGSIDAFGGDSRYLEVGAESLALLNRERTSAVSAPLYLRFHGRNTAAWWNHEKSEDRYNYLYSPTELQPYAEGVRAASAAGRKVLAFMNNHYSAKAVANAAILKSQLGQSVPGVYEREMVDRYPDLQEIVTTSGLPL